MLRPPETRRRSRWRAIAAAAIASSAMLAPTQSAEALVYTDLNDFNMTHETRTYGSTFHVSSDSIFGNIEYRWLDDTGNADSVISSNYCSDLSMIGSSLFDAPYYETYYASIGSRPAGSCFRVRGRVASYSSPFYNHDGRVNR